MPDVWSLLTTRTRTEPGGPIVTYVDVASGQRAELSAASLQNAAAKIANVLQQEYDLAPGSRLGLHLPVHWQRSAWCAGSWTAECVVVPEAAQGDLVVADAERAEFLVAEGSHVAVVSMHPLGLPHDGPLPRGAEDVTLAVRQQPDAFLGTPPSERATALEVEGQSFDQADLLERAGTLGRAWGLEPGGRLLVDDRTDPVVAWWAALAVPLACRASVVLVRGDGAQVSDQERVTARA